MTTINPVDLGSSLSSINDATSAQSAAALKLKGKAKGAAENFESMFLSNMFQEMFTGVDGDGPMGGSGALKVWRSFAIDQFAKSFAKEGGIGIASKVYDTLLKEQGLSAS
jgi:Rod binding domain-containing protein